MPSSIEEKVNVALVSVVQGSCSCVGESMRVSGGVASMEKVRIWVVSSPPLSRALTVKV